MNASFCGYQHNRSDICGYKKFYLRGVVEQQWKRMYPQGGAHVRSDNTTADLVIGNHEEFVKTVKEHLCTDKKMTERVFSR